MSPVYGHTYSSMSPRGKLSLRPYRSSKFGIAVGGDHGSNYCSRIQRSQPLPSQWPDGTGTATLWSAFTASYSERWRQGNSDCSIDDVCLRAHAPRFSTHEGHCRSPIDLATRPRFAGPIQVDSPRGLNMHFTSTPRGGYGINRPILCCADSRERTRRFGCLMLNRTSSCWCDKRRFAASWQISARTIQTRSLSTCETHLRGGLGDCTSVIRIVV
jgi:hypothetical protein